MPPRQSNANRYCRLSKNTTGTIMSFGVACKLSWKNTPDGMTNGQDVECPN